MFRSKKILAILGATVLLAAVSSALAGNTTLFSSKQGDITFPFTAPLRDGTAGAIDNMIVGATTPRAGTFTTLTAAQVNAILGSYAVNPASATYYPSYQFANNQGDMLFSSAASVSYAYVTLAAAPIDGWKSCLFSSGAITTLYVYGNTGQTVSNAATSLSAAARQCYTYSLSNTTWYRSN